MFFWTVVTKRLFTGTGIGCLLFIAFIHSFVVLCLGNGALEASKFNVLTSDLHSTTATTPHFLSSFRESSPHIACSNGDCRDVALSSLNAERLNVEEKAAFFAIAPLILFIVGAFFVGQDSLFRVLRVRFSPHKLSHFIQFIRLTI